MLINRRQFVAGGAALLATVKSRWSIGSASQAEAAAVVPPIDPVTGVLSLGLPEGGPGSDDTERLQVALTAVSAWGTAGLPATLLLPKKYQVRVTRPLFIWGYASLKCASGKASITFDGNAQAFFGMPVILLQSGELLHLEDPLGLIYPWLNCGTSPGSLIEAVVPASELERAIPAPRPTPPVPPVLVKVPDPPDGTLPPPLDDPAQFPWLLRSDPGVGYVVNVYQPTNAVAWSGGLADVTFGVTARAAGQQWDAGFARWIGAGYGIHVVHLHSIQGATLRRVTIDLRQPGREQVGRNGIGSHTLGHILVDSTPTLAGLLVTSCRIRGRSFGRGGADGAKLLKDAALAAADPEHHGEVLLLGEGGGMGAINIVNIKAPADGSRNEISDVKITGLKDDAVALIECRAFTVKRVRADGISGRIIVQALNELDPSVEDHEITDNEMSRSTGEDGYWYSSRSPAVNPYLVEESLVTWKPLPTAFYQLNQPCDGGSPTGISIHNNTALLPAGMPIPISGDAPVAHIFVDVIRATDSSITDNTFYCDAEFVDPETGEHPAGADPGIRTWSPNGPINTLIADNHFAGEHPEICRDDLQAITPPCA